VALLRIGAVALACIVGAPAAATASTGTPFGIASFAVQTTRAREVPRGTGASGYGFVNEPYAFTQAGGHPEALTSTVEFASEETGENHTLVPTRPLQDLMIGLPPGLLADPQALPRCLRTRVLLDEPCPVDSQVGVFVAHISGQAVLGPIFNLTPQAGETAELGLRGPHLTLLLSGHLTRTTTGYSLQILGSALPPELEVVSMQTTLWGVPAASVHDPQRTLLCHLPPGADQQWSCEGGGVPSGALPQPFLTMPSDCAAGVQLATAWADSWEEPGRYAQARSTLPGMGECDQLRFDPEIEVQPDTLLADQPVGESVEIQAPQTQSERAAATPPLRAATVTLPQGVSINPAVADGLRACQASGPEGIDIPTGLNPDGEPLVPGEVGEGEQLGPEGEPRLAPGHCPEASAVGSAEALTPLLPNPIKGRVYLAAPGCGGPGQAACSEADAVDGNLYRLYVEVGGNGEPDEGVDIKLEGEVQANPATGQLTVKLIESPQLPLSTLDIDLTGGPRALLANPATCGPALTSAALEPWSAPGVTPPPASLSTAGTPDADPSSFYEVTGCANPPLFKPGFLAGTITPAAGAFSAFTVSVTRNDGEQYLSGLQLHGPPGLSAMLASVPLCEAAPAATGTCPQASRVGSTLIGAGAGSHPFEMPGSIYLTGGYDGAPFGLSIVTDALAGPLNLGPVVIRAQVNIDPETAALTITSGPLPQVVLGVPLRLQKLTLDIDRPDFIFNPTNCGATAVTGTIASATGASATVSSPFAAANCASLPFSPKLTVSTQAKSSRRDGANLVVSISSPGHGQANLAKMALQLPSRLPPRFSTLQASCPAGQFAANPAACPQGSNIGIATVATPLLRAPLTGPVYFVSHPGPKFPELIMVLQGEGVTLELSAQTRIDSAKATTITAPTLPDMPFTRLTLTLPGGPHSALAAPRGKLCQDHLVMPTRLTDQNGAVLTQNTKVHVTGCNASKSSTARKLAIALERCRKKDSSRHGKGRREACERKAREQSDSKKQGRDRQAGSLRRARHG
jgi:hypothetical protein